MPIDDKGYTSVRISKRAYRELTKRALSERRTLVATLDMILGL